MGSRGSVVVVGSVNADLVVRAERAPAGGETVVGLDFATYAGGKGANQAAGVGRLGTPVAMVGLVGEDASAEMLRAALTGCGVEVSGLGTVAGPTGVALIVTEASGRTGSWWLRGRMGG